VAASRLLMKDNIANALAERRAKISSKLEVTAERVIAELAALGFANIADFCRENEDGTLAVDTDALLDPARAAAITQVDVQTAADGAQSIKIKLADKKAALVELGKHLGLFNERPEPPPAAEHDQISLCHQAMAICALFREAQLEAESGPVIDGESWIEDVALLSR
jgi:phage terminase small subunit